MRRRRDNNLQSLGPTLDLSPLPPSPVLVGESSLVRALKDQALHQAQLAEAEDTRQWHPLGPDRPARDLSGRPRGVQVNPLKLAHALSFHQADPLSRVVTCVRRKARREIMHALKLTRKGAGGAKRRNWRSDIKC